MSLTYDPHAIRYASTQEAYGCTWTLNKIEPDGAQVWKNAKGHEALVPKCTATVQANLGNPCVDVNTYRPSGKSLGGTGDVKAVWRLLDCGQPLKSTKRNPTPDDRTKPEPVLEIKFDSEVSAYFPISQEMREQWVNGTWENLEPNTYQAESQIDRLTINGKPHQLERGLGTPSTSYDNRINDTIEAKKMGAAIPDNYFFPPPITGSRPPPECELGAPEKPAPDPRRSRTIQSIGVDVSNSPPRTALVVAEKMVNGAIMIHDEMIVDKELTNEEIQELAKSLLNRAGAQSGRVSVDRANESNSKRVPRRHEIGDQKVAPDGSVLTWNGFKWRNSVTGKWYPEVGDRIVDSRGANPRKFDGEKWVRDS